MSVEPEGWELMNSLQSHMPFLRHSQTVNMPLLSEIFFLELVYLCFYNIGEI